MIFIRFFIFGFIFFTFHLAQAFPEMVRHGYVNCMACHVSPSGGGVLTEYGRALSKEVLSTWGGKNEERFGYFVKSNDKLLWGGDFRGIQVERDPASGNKVKKYYEMQNDLEVAATLSQFVASITVGQREASATEKEGLFSRRHFLMYKSKTEEHILRVGRFFPSVGIYIPDHNAVIRRGLVWDQGMESYNLEYSYLGEKWNFQGTTILGRPDKESLYREKGAAILFAYHPGDTYKIGTSYYYGESDLVSHHIGGPFAIFGFTSKFFLLSQVNTVRTFLSTREKPQWGYVNYQKLNYELFQGFHLFLTVENSELDRDLSATRVDTYGTGIQFFPRPHFEFQGFYQKQYREHRFATDTFALLWHFYP